MMRAGPAQTHGCDTRADLEAPPASTAGVRAVMQGNRRRDTSPELRLRSALHRAGLRFRCDQMVATPFGAVRPDIVFSRDRLAVFVDGCFWHRCSVHGTEPRANSEYWARKLDRNVVRDQNVDSWLNLSGWKVMRIWEHQDLAVSVATIHHALGKTPRAPSDSPAALRHSEARR
jgi:DNA mismatch endonuclease (patch repair protein)